MRKIISAVGAFFLFVLGLQAQSTGASSFAAAAQVGYRAVPNITYITANNYEAKLDLYRITDVADLLAGANTKVYAVTWLGSLERRKEIAARVSPLSYVRPGLPPIMSIQGDADPTVPYAHSVRLHAALEKAGVPNK